MSVVVINDDAAMYIRNLTALNHQYFLVISAVKNLKYFQKL